MAEKKKIYISGPMSGIKNNNREAFEKAEKKIMDIFYNSKNIRIVNPVELALFVEAEIKNPSWADYMKACIYHLVNCTHVYYLDGWKESKGAQLEKYIAESLGIPGYEDLTLLKCDSCLYLITSHSNTDNKYSCRSHKCKYEKGIKNYE